MLAWVLNTPLTKLCIAIKLFNNFIQSSLFFNNIAPVIKTELDFSLILCNAICDQFNRKCYLMYLFFVYSYVVSKIEKK